LYLLDANVLIYAFRRDSPHHSPCYQWLTNALAGEEPVATTSVVELALLRIATLPALGTAAAAAAEVFRFLGALKEQPIVLRIEPGEQHLDILSGLCAKLKLRGNDINDAFLAALSMEYGATLVTADRGFRRFSGVRVMNPLQEPAG
jgi:toxin-antitoxin system PIN domain toxin